MRVLVVGASRGIGEAIALALVERGDEVTAVGRDREALGAVVKAGRALEQGSIEALVADVTRRPDREHLGRLEVDALVYAAGVATYQGVGEISEHALRHQFEVNVFAPLLLGQALGPQLRRSRGAMVFVSSTLGERPVPMAGAYSASKAALNSAIATLAMELAPEVRVNGVAPGVVDTAMVRQLRVAPGEVPPANPEKVIEAQLEGLAQAHPMKRLGQPAEVASTVLHALDAPWMTGSILRIDGGIAMV